VGEKIIRTENIIDNHLRPTWYRKLNTDQEQIDK